MKSQHWSRICSIGVKLVAVTDVHAMSFAGLVDAGGKGERPERADGIRFHLRNSTQYYLVVVV